MPDSQTMRRARRDAREGKSSATQAGEFVREEFRHIREGMHGARSARQAIAIGLSKARRAGVNLPPPRPGKTSEKVRKQARRDLEKGRGNGARHPSARRSRATLGALRHEDNAAASHRAISRQAHRSSKNRTASERSAAARKAARTRQALVL
jgi:hypothetical protein